MRRRSACVSLVSLCFLNAAFVVPAHAAQPSGGTSAGATSAPAPSPAPSMDAPPAPFPAADAPLNLIAFGSCARDRRPQPVWEQILAAKPDLFLFIGDNNYADFWEKDGKVVMEAIPNVQVLKDAYARQAAHEGYRRLRAQTPMMVTWDDHDYGDNDAGKEFPLREDSRKVFLDFYGFATDAPERAHQGVYNARSFGPPGRRVQIIMLDTRYNRDALERLPRGEQPERRGRYVPTADTSKTILGDAQWKWLEERLNEPADVRLIVSSIQVVADEHGFETWGNFPHERQRLYDLIAKTNAGGVVLLSGDRHLTEVSVDRGAPGRAVPYPMWDFTSSGMTDDPRPVTDVNTKRVGPARRETTFGTVQIVWGDSPQTTQIEFTALGGAGQMLTRQSVFLSDLKPLPAAKQPGAAR